MTTKVCMRKGIYGFTADPITYGHIHLIERAVALVDVLWVVVFDNAEKRPLLSKSKRLALVRLSLKHVPHVKVDASSRLLADYAYQKGITISFRGVRNAKDLEMERAFMKGHRHQWKELETVLLPTAEPYEHISSSMAKTILRDGGDVRAYVPLWVKQAMEEAYHKQFLLGITGSIGVGKSSLSQRMKEGFLQMGLEVAVIDMDKEVKKLYRMTQRRWYASLVEEIVDIFGKKVLADGGGIAQERLVDVLFKSADAKEKLRRLQESLKQPLLSLMRKRLHKTSGIILVEAAMLAEYDMLWMVNNHVLLVDMDEKELLNRLEKRDDFDENMARKRIELTGTGDIKRVKIKELIRRDGFGHLLMYDNGVAINRGHGEYVNMSSSEFAYEERDTSSLRIVLISV